MIYYISEIQNLRSFRKADRIEADSLIQAKRIASRLQEFNETILVIGSSVNNNGLIRDPICYKQYGKWRTLK